MKRSSLSVKNRKWFSFFDSADAVSCLSVEHMPCSYPQSYHLIRARATTDECGNV